MANKTLYSLQFQTTNDFYQNLTKLLSLVSKCEKDSIILAPEVVLTGFYYQDMAKAANFYEVAKKELLKVSKDKTIALSMITKEESGFKNRFFVFDKGEITHTQSKTRLFELGDEHKYFIAGNEDEILFFEIDGIKCACLICFELRFLELWQKIKGAELVFVPAMWGRLRKRHYETLTEALAIINQCYILASNSSNDDMASSSAIISPFGQKILDDSKEILSFTFDKKEIEKMRRYLNIGLSF